MKKNSTKILLIIILLALGLRFYKIEGPIADWHSWRQADTSAVSRNFIKSGFDFLHPRFDDLSNIPSGKDNPNGYRFVEFPIYNTVTATSYRVFPVISIEIWGRLLSIFASLGTLIFLYLLAKKYLGEQTALFSAFFFAFLPYNIYYSRVILPEPFLVFTSIGGIYFLDKWLENNKIFFWVLSITFSILALLIKVYAVFFWPVIIYLLYKKFKFKALINPLVIFYFFLSFLPIFLWRDWMLKFPEGIPASDWLFNGGNIRFRPAFFRWIFYERLTKLVLGFTLLPFLVIGLFSKTKKEGFLFYWWIVGMLMYVSIIARGNVQHDYYQVMIIPIVCIFLGKGLNYIFNLKVNSRFKNILIFTSFLLIIVSFYISWQTIKTYYWINNPKIIEAGIAVDELTPKNAKIIAPYGGDTSFLYQTNRQGWPQGFEIEEKIKKGADYYVNINLPDPETKYVMEKWQVIKKTDKYVIVKLK